MATSAGLHRTDLPSFGLLSGNAYGRPTFRPDITVMDRSRQAHPSSAPTPHNKADVDVARHQAHFRLLAELYRERRPVAKRRRWPAVRTRPVVVPISAARRWQKTGAGAS